MQGNYTKALEWVERFIAAAPSSGLQAQGYLWKSFYHALLGQIDQSYEDIEQADELVESVGNKYAIAVGNIIRGMIYLDIGEYELSFRHSKVYSDFVMKSDPQNSEFNRTDFNLYGGLIDVQAGKIDAAKLKLKEARTLLPESIKQNPTYENFHRRLLAMLHAEISLVEGLPSGTIEIMENSPIPAVPTLDIQPLIRLNWPLRQDVWARAYVKNGELNKAIAEYEELITFDPNSTDRRIVHPKYHYELAKLYEQKNWYGKAIEHYEKFLDLWKDADEGLPELEDARKKLVSLKGE
jgi:tetratricopeptide (TPR) repeat protein